MQSIFAYASFTNKLPKLFVEMWLIDAMFSIFERLRSIDVSKIKSFRIISLSSLRIPSILLIFVKSLEKFPFDSMKLKF